MDWREVLVSTDREGAEAVSNILMEAGAGGVVFDDPALVEEYMEKGGWDAHEINLREDKDVIVKAYFPIDDEIESKINRVTNELTGLSQRIPGSFKGIFFSTVREEDWANAWKSYYKPVKVTSTLVIKPSWEDYRPSEDEKVIELDPGMAFGTGTHETTVMCLKLLEERLKPKDRVIDVGTGSGILSVAAAKLGAGEVLAIDFDAVAVRVAKENIEKNNVGHIVRVTQGDLLDKADFKADIIVANIIATAIVNLCPLAGQALKDGGLFIASGIIKSRWPEVKRIMAEYGWEVEEILEDKEWVAVVAHKEG